MQTKICSICRVELPLTPKNFARDCTSSTGFQGRCKPCWNAKRRERRKDPEYHERELNRKRTYRADPVKHERELTLRRARWQVRYHNDPEFKAKERLDGKRTRARNPEHYRAKSRDGYHHRPGAKEAQKRSALLSCHRRRAKLKEAGGTFTQKDIQLIYQSQKGLCWWCGKPLNGIYHMDHRIPISRGGTNWPNNIVLTCETCNLSKSDKLPHEWIGRLF